MPGKFYILEFGGQHTDLIRNRFWEMGYDVSIVPSSTPMSQMRDAYGLVLSGGPKSVLDPKACKYDDSIFKSDIPKLGICYGMQLMAKACGGEVKGDGHEYGESVIRLVDRHPLFKNVPMNSIGWMNHGDTVNNVGDSFDVLAYTDKSLIGAMATKDGSSVAVQFHPELTHTTYGTRMLRNFATLMCNAGEGKAGQGFNPHRYLQECVDRVKSEVGKRKMFLLMSGGVDSTVCGKIVLEAGVDLVPVHHDLGVERHLEAKKSKAYLDDLLGIDLYINDVSGEIVGAMRGITGPREKRLNFREFYEYATNRALDDLKIDRESTLFGQGTLSTDKRESGHASGIEGGDAGEVGVIKYHHNVDGDFGMPEIEILGNVSKQEVRMMAEAAGFPDHIVHKPPFPGPGLTVRMINETHPVRPEDYVRVQEMAANWGMSGYLTPIKTVGIKGDSRSFEHMAIIAGRKDWRSIKLAAKFLAEGAGVNRVCYYWGTDPRLSMNSYDRASQIEFSMENLDMLREVTQIAEDVMGNSGVRYDQMPVVLFPGPDGPYAAVRDFDSKDFRSGRPLSKPDEMPWGVCEDIATGILKRTGVEAVLYDASTKPAGTTEWE